MSRPALLASTLILLGQNAVAETSIPADAQPTSSTCAVSADTLAKFFEDGSITANGFVLPPKSSGFPTNNTDCDFYVWGAQMFLWLTSRTTTNGLTLDSEIFYNVLPADPSDSTRRLAQGTGAIPAKIAVRAHKLDSEATPTEEIGELGQAGAVGAKGVGETDATGETGTDFNVLMSQGGSLVYYGIHVNDNYAYFQAWQKTEAPDSVVDFPTTTDQLTSAIAYATGTLKDPAPTEAEIDTLTVELKTAWVDAATLPPGTEDRFITIDAKVPGYTKTNPTTMTPTGEQDTKKLALTGLHVVGTVAGHPEMVWMSFEHVLNAPMDTYYYTKTGSATPAQVEFDATGPWVFMGNEGKNIENTPCMVQVPDGSIKATEQIACGGVIAPSDTVRHYPWGNAAGDTEFAGNNADIIAVNHSIMSQLTAGDLRGNYMLIGGVWTSSGPDADAAPDAPIPGSTGYTSAAQRGSLALSNASMETYQQGFGCFDCHQILQTITPINSFQEGGLSHIYADIDYPVGTAQ